MKKILATVAILGLAAVIAVPVLAQGPGYAKGRGMAGLRGADPGAYPRYGWACEKMTDEQLNQLAELRQKHYDETAETRSQLWARQAELNVLLNTSAPDLDKAKALQKEISDLRSKMGQERINFYGEAKKINPDFRFHRSWGRGKGYGPFPEGDGLGMSRAWPRAGFGMGPCLN
jgi:Spy/CpxP family protein refolding chaperone